jgi:hypothetical protein
MLMVEFKASRLSKFTSINHLKKFKYLKKIFKKKQQPIKVAVSYNAANHSTYTILEAIHPSSNNLIIIYC